MTKTEKQTAEVMSFLLPGVIVFLMMLVLIAPRCAIGVAPYALIELLGIIAVGKAFGYLRGEHGLKHQA